MFWHYSKITLVLQIKIFQKINKQRFINSFNQQGNANVKSLATLYRGKSEVLFYFIFFSNTLHQSAFGRGNYHLCRFWWVWVEGQVINRKWMTAQRITMIYLARFSQPVFCPLEIIFFMRKNAFFIKLFTPTDEIHS